MATHLKTVYCEEKKIKLGAGRALTAVAKVAFKVVVRVLGDRAAQNVEVNLEGRVPSMRSIASINAEAEAATIGDRDVLADAPEMPLRDIRNLQRVPTLLEMHRDVLVRAAREQVGAAAGEQDGLCRVDWVKLVWAEVATAGGPIAFTAARVTMDVGLLAHLARACCEGTDQAHERDKFLLGLRDGSIPDDCAARVWAQDNKCFAGVMRTIKYPDGTRVDIRVRDLRFQLVQHLHDLWRRGYLQKNFGKCTLKVSCWRDGTAILKKSVFGEIMRLQNDSKAFSKDGESGRQGVTRLLVTQFSMHQPESKTAHKAVGYVVGLMLERLIEPITILDDAGAVVGEVRIIIDALTGDNHALQGGLGHNQAGNHVCVFGHHIRGGWPDIVAMLAALRKTAASMQQRFFANGETLAFAVGGEIAMFGGGCGADAGCDVGLSTMQAATDANLHERSGVIKRLLLAFVDRMSKKDKELLYDNFVDKLGRQGWSQYMDGKDWLNLLLAHEEALDYKVECLHLWYYVREIVLICCHDDPEDVAGGRRALVLALHANCMALGLVLMDLSRRSAVGAEEDLNVLEYDVQNLYLHHFVADLAQLYETQDFKLMNAQDLGNYLGQAKEIVRNLTNRKDAISFTIIVMSKYRASNPIGDVVLPAKLVQKHAGLVKAYFELRIIPARWSESESVGYSAVKDWNFCECGDLIFRITGEPQPPLAQRLGVWTSVSTPKGKVAFKSCDRPTDDELRDHYLLGDDAWFTSHLEVVLKRILFDYKLPQAGNKA
ncbi:hypothetical protein M885DRAFT_567103, partial [Pelagophyceae sp. CCMP2097]